MILFIALFGCSNAPEFETGEIKTLKLLKNAFSKQNNNKVFLDARNLLSRKTIDEFDIPILFVELETGQNGTLTLYPGQGIYQTWLGADGATITLDRGILVASRGMGDDIMDASNSMPDWKDITERSQYVRMVGYLTGNNKIQHSTFDCNINKIGKNKKVDIWGSYFYVQEYQEKCAGKNLLFKNFYYVDDQKVVRRSLQYHSETLGYVLTERLDR